MDIDQTVELQMRAWNTDDPGDRIRLLELACTLDATFTSPVDAVAGLGRLSEQIGEFRREFPAAVVSASAIQAHHGYARWHWLTDWNDGREPLSGEDFADLTADGRIARIVTFWHSAPEVAG